MKISKYERGQGLVSYALILVLIVLLVLGGLSIFFGIKSLGLFVVVIVSLWLIRAVLGLLYMPLIELLRQLQMFLLLLLTMLRLYQPMKHSTIISMNRIVWQLLSFYQPLLLRRGISVKFNSSQLPYVRANRKFVEDILHHLISNAIKYSTNVSEPTIEIHGEIDNGQIRYAVTDNGVGIPETHQERVFDWFFRLQHPGTYGLGIGLSVVRFLVRQMGGECGVESEPDTGSIFWFTLPPASVDQP